ncbi:hypothetical protein S40293_08692 [Stachybotrys chartarum IBT 40293]|nr:hypothetical protein S40293_08692 [Stachybotrys chartarum IBT 40293]
MPSFSSIDVGDESTWPILRYPPTHVSRLALLSRNYRSGYTRIASAADMHTKRGSEGDGSWAFWRKRPSVPAGSANAASGDDNHSAALQDNRISVALPMSGGAGAETLPSEEAQGKKAADEPKDEVTEAAESTPKDEPKDKPKDAPQTSQEKPPPDAKEQRRGSFFFYVLSGESSKPEARRQSHVAPDEQDDYVVVAKTPSNSGEDFPGGAASSSRRSSKSFKERFWSRKGANVFDDEDAGCAPVQTGGGSHVAEKRRASIPYVPTHAAADFARSVPRTGSVSSEASGAGSEGRPPQTHDEARHVLHDLRMKRHSHDSRASRGSRVGVIVEEKEKEAETGRPADAELQPQSAEGESSSAMRSQESSASSVSKPAGDKKKQTTEEALAEVVRKMNAEFDKGINHGPRPFMIPAGQHASPSYKSHKTRKVRGQAAQPVVAASSHTPTATPSAEPPAGAQPPQLPELEGMTHAEQVLHAHRKNGEMQAQQPTYLHPLQTAAPNPLAPAMSSFAAHAHPQAHAVPFASGPIGGMVPTVPPEFHLGASPGGYTAFPDQESFSVAAPQVVYDMEVYRRAIREERRRLRGAAQDVVDNSAAAASYSQARQGSVASIASVASVASARRSSSVSMARRESLGKKIQNYVRPEWSPVQNPA